MLALNFDVCYDFLEHCRKKNGKVLIHCLQGLAGPLPGGDPPSPLRVRVKTVVWGVWGESEGEGRNVQG